jgi:hypothetical protein
MLFYDHDEVAIPAEALEYIDKRLKGNEAAYKFEILELFFEWLSFQTIERQKSILSKAILYGRVERSFSSIK